VPVSEVGGAGLTAALLAPVSGAAEVVRQTAATLPETLAGLAATRRGSASLRLTDHDVRLALGQPGGGPADTPFAWSARTARRAIGLAAVRLMVSTDVRSPAEGVTRSMDRAVVSVHLGQRPTSTLDTWLAGLAPAARSGVEAEAVTWATRLWCALDWSAFATAPTIGRDQWWDSPHSSLLALRSRAEVRGATVDAAGSPASVHLVLLGGPRRATVRSELCVVALVEALRAPRSVPPGRVVGWWPDSGHLVTVAVDGPALQEGVDAVARTLAALGTVNPPLEAQSKAAA
jgi:hypothetical protein